MANTYFKLYIHVIFAVKERVACIPPTAQGTIFSYIAGIINNLGHKALAVGGTDNHVHILFSYNPELKLSDTLRDIKAGSSKFINEQMFIRCRFEWQRGYAAFSCSQSQLDTAIRYIMHQPEHHKKMSLHDEICRFMERYEIDFDEKYILQEV